MPSIVHFDPPAGDGRVLKVGACQRDRHDPEHTHYQASQWEPDQLPGFVDLRPHLTPIEDQGEVGSCTANALAGALEYLEKRTNGHDGRVSRLFIFWNERDFEGKTSTRTSGAALFGQSRLRSGKVAPPGSRPRRLPGAGYWRWLPLTMVPMASGSRKTSSPTRTKWFLLTIAPWLE